jgi:DNA-binding NtrC family response regulator
MPYPVCPVDASPGILKTRISMATVLLVGFDRAASEACRDGLEKNGYRVIVAHDTRHATRLEISEGPAAIITGEDIAEEDRRIVLRHAHYRHVPAIVVLPAGCYPKADISWLAHGFVRSGEAGRLQQLLAEATGIVSRTANVVELHDASEFDLDRWDSEGLD